jgi:sulfate transport system ATP-binding protein
MGIQVKHITKKFGNFVALNDVSLDIRSGELVALLGPSGSGKTSLLRIIAGLDKAESGSVLMDGQETRDKAAKERQVGFVFQHYALFKHMTVFENVAFGLRVRPKEKRPSEEEIRKKVISLLTLVHLDKFYDRYPSQLSGGQRQRVALARALAVEPKVLLLDEPFGALDAKVRKELRRWMRRLIDEIGITSIFVTHDQEEAMEVSDRVVVMSNGRIEQVGTPEEVYHSPANGFVYDFLGNYNEFIGWKDEKDIVHLADEDLENSVFDAPALPNSNSWLNRYPEITNVISKIIPGILPETSPLLLPQKKTRKLMPAGVKPLKLFARPHEMWITKEMDEHEYIRARVVHINPAGSLAKLDLERRNGVVIQAEIPKEVLDRHKIQKYDEVFVRPKNTRIFE